MGTNSARPSSTARCIAVGILALLAPTLCTSEPKTAFLSGAYAPVHDQDVPLYFAGTNCRANGEIWPVQHPSPPGPEYVQHAEIKLNGTIVREFNYDPLEGPPLMNFRLEVVFDSTHFAPGSNVLVEVSGTDNRGANYYDSYTVVTKNKMVLLSLPSIASSFPPDSDTGQIFSDEFVNPGFQRIVDSQTTWDEPTQFLNLQGANAFIVMGHGHANSHSTGYYDVEIFHDYANVDPFEAEAWMQNIVGTGTPPWNSTGTPPLQFVYIDSCNSGDSNDFIRYCWPYYQWYGTWLEDQCVVAWTVFTSGMNGRSARVLAQFLGSGYPVKKARNNLVALAQIDNTGYFNLVADVYNDPPQYRKIAAGDLALYGDENTKLRGVYTGDDSISLAWFKNY